MLAITGRRQNCDHCPLGGQCMTKWNHYDSQGRFTGSSSPSPNDSPGCTFVIIGWPLILVAAAGIKGCLRIPSAPEFEKATAAGKIGLILLIAGVIAAAFVPLFFLDHRNSDER